MSQSKLPMDLPLPQEPAARPPTLPDQARVLRPVRNQVMMVQRDLDSFVPDDHPVRAIWALIQRLDLTAFYAQMKATIERPGRPAIDPPVLLALWVYATTEGIGSGRRLDALCSAHDAYRWLCGGVAVNYHTLLDFRVAHQAEMDAVLSEIVATLMAADLVTLKHVAQDGVRVRARAGAGSFHRETRLEQCLTQAQEQVQRLAHEREHPDPQITVRERQARLRAAVEREKRIEEALGQMPMVRAAKERQQRTLAKTKRDQVSEPRVSTTDPDARVMKMPDGGFRPALNTEVATDVGSGVIVGVDVINQGSDAGQAVPMVEQVVKRTGRTPEKYSIDGGFAQRKTITTLTERGITVYAPVRPPRTTTSGRVQETARPDDTPAVVAWRTRMETDEAKAIYRKRAATAEWANAQLRQHGLHSFSVRGVAKARSVALLMVVTHNLLRWIAWEA